MPAFCVAISASVFPNTCMWSKPTVVITDTNLSGITSVVSQVPPIPTSNTTTSTGCSAKYTNIMAVNVSNSVGPPCGNSLSNASVIGAMRRIISNKISSGILPSLPCTRSLNCRINGDVNIPTVKPAARNNCAIILLVEPLPFVPVTCTYFDARSG